METGKLKRFATEARVNLMEGVKRKLRLLGFDERGNAASEPQLVQGATLWKGEEYPEDFYNQWKTLQQRLSEKGLREVAEEASYTWFNRMMAIRILSMNGFCEPILRIDPTIGLPNLLAYARMGRIPEMSAQQRHRLDILMDDDTKSYEQFALLLTAWCHDNPIINACFGSINDYVELLLPDNVLRPDGFISLLNEKDFISEEDYKSAELIGWLYQFYISDRKDEVFAKKGKVEAEEIPAATQIFTPNWIVKYMVQNTILPQVDAPEEIIEKAKYLVKVEGADNCKVELEDIKVADFACGSGHILNECFDILFELYRSEAYSRKEAIENIFTKNLTGIDIDLRAKQLATFALLLKACQKDESFIDAHCLPHVITVPSLDSVYFNGEEIDAKEFIHHFFKGTETKECAEQLNEAIKLVAKADSLGSIIKFNLSSSTRRQLVETVNHWKNNEEQSDSLKKHLEVFDFILSLTNYYHAIVMNPPYMGANKMPNTLSNYSSHEYNESSADLMTIFMQVCQNRCMEGSYWAMINLPSWMFLNSFEEFRKNFIRTQNIIGLNQNGRGLFGADFGSVTFVVKNIFPSIKGVYRKLFQKHVQVRSSEKIESLYLNPTFGYYKANQLDFLNIPGTPVCYWMSTSLIDAYAKTKISDFGEAKKGLSTGNNERFLRLWYEVNRKNEIFDSSVFMDNIKWYPINKGGAFRLWYGNNDYIINWYNNGSEIKNFEGSVIRNPNYYLRESLTWTMLSSSTFGIRYSTKGKLFEGAGPSLFLNSDILSYIQGILTSKIGNFLLKSLNPTINLNIGDILNFPIIISKNKIEIEKIVRENVLISKTDWDAHETSWDFETNELVRIKKEELRIKNIEEALNAYKEKWTNLFFQLHKNEEGLNRQFIEIYGLQDELTPDVPLDEITILQQGEIKINEKYKIENRNLEDALEWQDNIIIKQLISYIVGVYMGRYRLDKPGLHIAYPDPSDEDLAPYDFSITHNETITIDTDAIIPVLPKDAPFYDNLYNYVIEFIGKVWGPDELTENLNFIEKALGKSLDDYLLKDFWKDHKKMYQKRPIYWEFASKKGAFKAIIFAHRMDKYTIEVLRSKYILPYIKFIENKISTMESREQELSTKERRELDNLRTKILPELEEYHSRVEQVAAETAARPQVFDLDDGIPHNHSLFGDIATRLK